mmetsp:Transcript_12984/g.31631  ORF Transcript_12984/g.31631 Transcript_12984/m.31631 type:complete len:230 (-) Transcript_12984:98-787(-)
MSAVESVKVVLLGDSGVGKSSLALRFVTDEFRPYSEATIGASFMSKSVTLPALPSKDDSSLENTKSKNENANDCKPNSTQQPQNREIAFKIWDTAGQEKYRSLAPMYYRGSSAAILVYDITKPGSFAALQDWADELKQNGPQSLVLAVCANKTDLEDDRSVGRSTGENYAKSIGSLYAETSAKGGNHVEQMFLDIARMVPPPIIMGDELLEEDIGLDLGKSSEHSRSCC